MNMHKRSIPSSASNKKSNKRRKCTPVNRRPPFLSVLRNALAGDELYHQLDLVQLVHQYVRLTECHGDHLTKEDVETFYHIHASDLHGFQCIHSHAYKHDGLYNRDDVLCMGSRLYGSIVYLTDSQTQAIETEKKRVAELEAEFDAKVKRREFDMHEGRNHVLYLNRETKREHQNNHVERFVRRSQDLDNCDACFEWIQSHDPTHLSLFSKQWFFRFG